MLGENRRVFKHAEKYVEEVGQLVAAVEVDIALGLGDRGQRFLRNRVQEKGKTRNRTIRVRHIGQVRKGLAEFLTAGQSLDGLSQHHGRELDNSHHLVAVPGVGEVLVARFAHFCVEDGLLLEDGVRRD